MTTDTTILTTLNNRSTDAFKAAVKQSGLRPVRLGLFPDMDNLPAVIDLGVSQLPREHHNQLVVILMIYHNTMVKIMEESKHATPA